MSMMKTLKETATRVRKSLIQKQKDEPVAEALAIVQRFEDSGDANVFGKGHLSQRVIDTLKLVGVAVENKSLLKEGTVAVNQEGALYWEAYMILDFE